MPTLRSCRRRSAAPDRQYRYGRKILLGEGAEFGLLLGAIHEGKVYYDPGIKLEGVERHTETEKT